MIAKRGNKIAAVRNKIRNGGEENERILHIFNGIKMIRSQ